MNKSKITALVTALIFLTNFSVAQNATKKSVNEPLTFIGGGISYFNEDVKESSKMALNFSICTMNFYLDFASNLAKGKGTELDFQSSETRISNKMQLNVFNLGYAIRLNKVSIFPVIGYGWTRSIYEDPIAFDTYYYGEAEGKFNFGIKSSFNLFGNGGLIIGVGTF